MFKKYNIKTLDKVNTSFLVLTPLLAIVLVGYCIYNYGFSWQQFLVAAIFYTLTGISITAGYHRLFSHRAYKSRSWVKFLFLVFGAAAFQNSAIKWCSDHRVHHNKVDTDEDPYNINEGFFYAHIGWIFLKQNPTKVVPFAKDLANDKLVMWQHRNYLAIAVIFGFGLPSLIGYFLGSALTGLAFAGLGRLVFVHHTTFFINSLCHVLGSQPYTDETTARDSIVMAFLSNGEGYHNYHHTFQTDYRNGIRWYHFDPSKWLIACLSFIGQAWDLKKTPAKRINDALERMRISAKKASSSLAKSKMNAQGI